VGSAFHYGTATDHLDDVARAILARRGFVNKQCALEFSPYNPSRAYTEVTFGMELNERGTSVGVWLDVGSEGSSQTYEFCAFFGRALSFFGSPREHVFTLRRYEPPASPKAHRLVLAEEASLEWVVVGDSEQNMCEASSLQLNIHALKPLFTILHRDHYMDGVAVEQARTAIGKEEYVSSLLWAQARNFGGELKITTNEWTASLSTHTVPHWNGECSYFGSLYVSNIPTGEVVPQTSIHRLEAFSDIVLGEPVENRAWRYRRCKPSILAAKNN
jgi:hypothetical protein